MAFVKNQDIQNLRAEVAALRNSKKATLARVNASPLSFEAAGYPVSDVFVSGFTTSFIVGGDVARVTVDAMSDVVTLQPIKRAGEDGVDESVVVDLLNKTPEVDFDAESAGRVYDAIELFDKGPKPTGEQIAVGLNAHVAKV